MNKDPRERPTIKDILSLDILQNEARKFGIFLGNRTQTKTIEEITEAKKQEILDQEEKTLQEKKILEQFEYYEDEKDSSNDDKDVKATNLDSFGKMINTIKRKSTFIKPRGKLSAKNIIVKRRRVSQIESLEKRY